MYVTVAQTSQSFPWQAGRQHHQTCLHLCPFPLLPLERSCLGAAAAAAPPVAAAQAPFSCSSPLLLVRLLFFPLLFFWLGILQQSRVSGIFDLYQRLLWALSDISVDSISAVDSWCFCSDFSLCCCFFLVPSWTTARVRCSSRRSRMKE